MDDAPNTSVLSDKWGESILCHPVRPGVVSLRSRKLVEGSHAQQIGADPSTSLGMTGSLELIHGN